MSLSQLVLKRYRVLADRQTDRITIANTRYSYSRCCSLLHAGCVN